MLCALSLKCWFGAWWWLQAIIFAVWILFCLKVFVFLCYLCVFPPPRCELHVRLYWLCLMCTLLFLDFDNEVDVAVVLALYWNPTVNHLWTAVYIYSRPWKWSHHHLFSKFVLWFVQPSIWNKYICAFSDLFPFFLQLWKFVLGFGWMWLWHTGCSRVNGFDECEHSGQVLLWSVFILQSNVFDGEWLKTYSHLFRACG